MTQRLAVLAIDVGRAETTGASAEHVASLSALREQLVKLSEDIHTLAYQLHPSVLEELGLVEALRVECERRNGRGGLEVRLDVEAPPEDLSPDAALCVLRVAQESLTNVARHAAAKVATVTLRAMGGGLVLAIGDDGIGFDPLGPRRKRNLGLVGMRERLQLVNGTFDVESAPGRGTTVVAWVPVEGGQR